MERGSWKKNGTRDEGEEIESGGMRSERKETPLCARVAASWLLATLLKLTSIPGLCLRTSSSITSSGGGCLFMFSLLLTGALFFLATVWCLRNSPAFHKYVKRLLLSIHKARNSELSQLT